MKGFRHVAVARTVAALASPDPSVSTAPPGTTELTNALTVSPDRPPGCPAPGPGDPSGPCCGVTSSVGTYHPFGRP